MFQIILTFQSLVVETCFVSARRHECWNFVKRYIDFVKVADLYKFTVGFQREES